MHKIVALALSLLSLAACGDLPSGPIHAADPVETRLSFDSESRLIGGAGVVAAQSSGGTTTGALPSEPARQCQMDGWASLVRRDGSGFRNTGDCVSYRVRGGELGGYGDDRCRTLEGGQFDFLIDGPANSSGSGYFYASNDGSCTGNRTLGTYIVADAEGDALELCFDATYVLDPAGWSPGVVVLEGIGTNEWACGDSRSLP
jgi:hypothetical protein